VVRIGVDEEPPAADDPPGGDAGGDAGNDGSGDDDGDPWGGGNALPPGFGGDTVTESCACRATTRPSGLAWLLLGVGALCRRRGGRQPRGVRVETR
jgi:hypothetical protein